MFERLINLAFIPLFLCISIAAEGAKLYPVDTNIIIVGLVKDGVGYDANGKREEYYYLKLDNPISVSGDDFYPGEKNVTKLELVPTGNFDLHKFYKKRIRVTGSFFHAENDHHHTRILLEIDKLSDVTIVKEMKKR